VNQRMNASQDRTTSSKSDGYGLGCGAHLHEVRKTPWSIDIVDREATVNACGVAVVKPQGQSWAPHPLNGSRMNVGTTPAVPYPASSQLVGGKTCRSLMLPEWGGGVVVVRGRESRPHGEGPQRVCSNRAERGGR